MMLVTANVFQPLIDVFEAVIKFFHNGVGIPWGWSIVLLTIVVRAAMIPLTLKQIKGMVRMQQLAPELKALQNKYKEDKQRQQQEMMKFYKENNFSPFSSCLPLVAQLPVFVSLYYMLRKSLRTDICPGVQKAFQSAYAAKHHIPVSRALGQTTVCGGHGANFLFIHDLTAKATGVTLIVLLVLYVGTQLASTMMMSAAATDPMQRRMMMLFPLVFVFVVLRFPAGVLVYWITTNTWTIGQQYIVRRRIGPVRAANAAAVAGGGGSAATGGAATGGAGSRSGGGGLMGRLMESLSNAQRNAGGGGPGPSSAPTSGGRSSGGSPARSGAKQTRAGRAKASGGARASGGSNATGDDRATNGDGAGGAKATSGGGGGASKRSSSKAKATNGGSGGLGATLRSKVLPGDGDGAKQAPVSTAARGAPPPKSPRKKKKRSGRRR
ncbi:MAG: membrane protein insertase YidC [Solirubrobacterales bacterium]|nr:membrane protein insertase YidC [Solirubrobacterales bacterium]